MFIRYPRRLDDLDIHAMEYAKRRREYGVVGSGETENAMRAAGLTGAAGRLVRQRLGCRGDKAQKPARRHGLAPAARIRRAQQQGLRGNGIGDNHADQRPPKRLGPMPSLINNLIIAAQIPTEDHWERPNQKSTYGGRPCPGLSAGVGLLPHFAAAGYGAGAMSNRPSAFITASKRPAGSRVLFHSTTFASHVSATV